SNTMSWKINTASSATSRTAKASTFSACRCLRAICKSESRAVSPAAGSPMQRNFNFPAALLIVASLLWRAAAGAQTTRVAIGYSGISADQLVIWVARDTGIFAKNGLDAQPVYFTGGTTSVTAMISGDTPMIQASGPGIVSAGLAGAEPVYVVGGIVSLDYWLMSRHAPRFHRGEPLRRAAGLHDGQHAGAAGHLHRAEKGLSSARRRGRSWPRLPAPGRRHHAALPARASRHRAQLRQILHRSGAPPENRPRRRAQDRRQISAPGRSRAFAQNLRKLDRRKQAADEAVAQRGRS